MPNIPGAGLSNNYLALDNNVLNKDQFTQRIDFVENEKSTWFGRYSFQNENAVSPALDQNGTILATGVQQGTLSNTRIISPNVVNEFRFGYAGFYNNFGNELQNQVDVIKNLGIGVFDPQPAAWGIPGISITSFSGFGTSVQGPWIINDHNFQWSDNISWTHGRHSLKFGAEFIRDQFNELGTQDARAALTVQNQATGYGFGDYMLGYLEENQDAAALAVGQYRSLIQSYYVDDNWKLKPNLTIDVGLRYEYNPPWSMKNNTEANVYVPPQFPFNPAGTGPANYSGPPLCMVRVGQGDMYAGVFTVFNPAMCTARDGRLGGRLVKADYKNFAPRLGIAWSPSPKWTIRTGAGIFYVQDTGNPVFDMARNLFGNVQNFTNIVTHNLTFENPFNTGGTNPCNVPSPPYTCLSTPQGLANQYNRRTPLYRPGRVQRSAAAEREYGSGSRLSRFDESLPPAFPHFEHARNDEPHRHGEFTGTGSFIRKHPVCGRGRQCELQRTDGQGDATAVSGPHVSGRIYLRKVNRRGQRHTQ